MSPKVYGLGESAGFRVPRPAGFGIVSGGFLAACMAALLSVWATTPRTAAAVALQLRIPEAETHVLGDPIPLFWRFGNQSTQALGFMWEGCCRLNGRLEVRAADRELQTVPPGQALAHMFAKADRLEPGVPKEYDTQVSDWVRLPGSGTYEMQGVYRGVLPSQVPQVARGLALWRDAARSSSVRLTVLSAADYLAQREDRVRRRGLRVTLAGPDRFTPLEPARFRVVLENPTDAVQTVAWPDDLALWVLDGRNDRVAPAAVLTGPVEVLAIPARGRLEREFAVGPDRFEGEPFGDYTVFVDLAASGDGRPRVPSTSLGMEWRWTPLEVRDLVAAAARGAGTGARNAPLKMLRVYLTETGPELARQAGREADPAVAGLAGRLAFAARIKPLRPQPGSVDLRLELGPEGGMRWLDPVVGGSETVGAGGGTVESELAAILGVRRHLGWEVAVAVEPAPGVRMARVFDLTRRFSGQSGELSGPVAVRIPVGGTNAPARLEVHAREESRPAGGAVLGIAGGGRDGSTDGRRWEPLSEDAVAGAWMDRVGGRPRVEVDPGMEWGVVREAVRAVLVPGLRLGMWEGEGTGR